MMHQYIYNGNLPGVGDYIRRGYIIQEEDVILAIRYGRKEIARLLVNAGAPVTHSMLKIIIQQGNMELLPYFLQFYPYSWIRLLDIVVQENQLNMLKYIIEVLLSEDAALILKSIEHPSLNSSIEPVFIYAASLGRLEIMQYLQQELSFEPKVLYRALATAIGNYHIPLIGYLRSLLGHNHA